ncbi:autotransporter domain-containing protein [Bradyrhizobium sp. BR 10289]|nr:autotransporter domain-containing protein [Bradyrhizobium sp. BR 10289]
MIFFTQIDAGRSLTAANVVNNGNMIVSGTLNATNSFASAIGSTILVDTTGTINGSVDAAGGYIQLYGTINGNLTLSGSLAHMNSYGGRVSGRVNLAASGALVYSTSGGATYGSLAGVAGTQADVGGFTLTVGGDNSDSIFAGAIIGTGNFVKTGSGTMLLSGNSGTYTGTTTVNGGTLMVNGSLAASAVTVNDGGSLNGSGTLGATQVNSGGLLAPGSFAPGTSMTLASLAMQSGAAYLVFVDPTTSTFATVTGNASLGGATVGAAFFPGSYVTKRYTILNAGSITGSFDPTVLSFGLPAGFHTSLSQDANHAYLDLALSFAPPSGSLNGNQQNVGNAIINFFNTNGTIPIAFGGLGPTGLAQLSGEVGSAPQQTTFGAMTQFMGVMTDPFVAGRDDAAGSGGASSAYAEESMAYAASGKGSTRREREAYAAMSTKAPAAPAFGQRWSVWAAGFGGSQTTDGSPVTGSNNTTSSLYGTAVGADYRISRDTLVGFALAGGGTNFATANNLGGGRSDLFQAGVHVRHVVGPAYISGALAYGWQNVVTDRTVTVAGLDRLRAEFNANAYSGRLEGGYRFVTQGIGLAPYAAAQFTTFDLPSYAEHAIVGSNQFALAYNGKSVTDTRSELGLRTDKSFAAPDGIITLRGRAAWAHDFNPDRAVGATFQALPGASFVVNGAAMAADAALVTGAIERKWLSGWSAAGTFEGEFSNVTRSYAGKGVVRYAW